MQISDLPWLQMSGAMAGGLVGSFSGFLANTVHEQRARRQARRNIACAIIGEIGALTELIEEGYTAILRDDVDAATADQRYPHFHFRGDRDYMTVFRAIGGSVGHLPTPLPRDLVSWYTRLATMLERARALNELSSRADPAMLPHAMELARIQQASLTELVESSTPLIARLKRL